MPRGQQGHPMNAEATKKPRDDRSNAISRKPDRWKVVTRVHPQGDAGVRWVQLTYVREPEPEDWPYERLTS